ncbi:hypothetical protein R69608_05067 [Paraburkholderia nemoris]|nr:hypothetical protein R69608_05067 [Paraburkholderia nemoris]
MLKGDATKTHRANGAHVCLRHFQFVDFVLVVSGNRGTAFRIRRQSADTVEKVELRSFCTVRKKFDLSDRPTNRSQSSVKGRTTHDNLVR